MIITAGKYKGRNITAPDEKITRPTLSKIRMGVFNSLYSIMEFEDKTFLDVFGGSGIMGLEAISRGFKEVTVFEINKKSAEIIRNNYKILGEKANLIIGDSLKLLQKNKNYFDVAYIDPPYKYDKYKEIISFINAGIIIVEHSQTIDFSDFNLIKSKKYGGTLITIIKKSI